MHVFTDFRDFPPTNTTTKSLRFLNSPILENATTKCQDIRDFRDPYQPQVIGK